MSIGQTSYSINTVNGFPGLLYALEPHEIVSAVNADTVAMPAGIAVCANQTSAVVEGQAFLPAGAPTISAGASQYILLGVLCHTHAEDTIGLQTQTASDNVFKVGTPVNILRKGKVYVNTEVAVSKGDPVFYRYTVNTGFPQLGSLSNVTDSGKNQKLWGAFFDAAGDNPPTNPGNMAVLNLDMNAFYAGLQAP